VKGNDAVERNEAVKRVMARGNRLNKERSSQSGE